MVFTIPQKAMPRVMPFPKYPGSALSPSRVPPFPRPHSGFRFPVGGGGDAHAEVSLLLSAMGDFAFVWLQIPRDRAVWGGEGVMAGCRLLPPVGG